MVRASPSALDGLRYAAAAFIGSVACGLAYRLVYRELGDSDVDVFISYAAIFALFSAALFTRLKFVFQKQIAVRSRALGLLAGLLTAIVWWIILGAVAGPSVQNVGIPLPLCWMCGGLAAGYVASSETVQSTSANVAYLFAMLLLTGGVWRETRAVPPHVLVYFRGSVDTSTRNEFFRTVIGDAADGSTEHSLRPEILRASVIRSAPTTVIELQLHRHIRDAAQRTLIQRLLAFPPVEKVVVTRTWRDE